MRPDDTSIFEQRESNVRSYSRAFPTVFQRAKGSEIFDASGRRYLDFFAGAGTLNYGHNPEALKKPLLEYLAQDGIIHALDAYTTAKRELLERFQALILAPRGMDHRVQFCGPTGTNAVEAALKLARKVTGRMGMFAFSGSYHGMSQGSSSVTGSRSVRASTGIPLGHTTFFPYPDGPGGAYDALPYMERMLADNCSGVDLPAAVILETVQMDGGIYIAPPEWLQALRAFTQRHGILLIVDDIQAGCGRTGRFFSFERAGITPDLVTLSKAIGGYGLPMSLLLMRPELDRWRPGEHTGTFRGNQLAFVAGSAALDFWKDERFTEELARKERAVADFLRQELTAKHSGLAVRGIGLAHGVDFSGAGGPERASQVQRRCFERGLIVEQCGRDDVVVKLLPPLTTPLEQLLEGCGILRDAIAD
ncbi:MAG: diaminobutyrate--2-oxoglutarate transaminase [Myxococcaceae bacterium]|nr:diaminobutyrate--2-oxoglutarate transaminase [Myxococcaceae bacterium]